MLYTIACIWVSTTTSGCLAPPALALEYVQKLMFASILNSHEKPTMLQSFLTCYSDITLEYFQTAPASTAWKQSLLSHTTNEVAPATGFFEQVTRLAHIEVFTPHRSVAKSIRKATAIAHEQRRAQGLPRTEAAMMAKLKP